MEWMYSIFLRNTAYQLLPKSINDINVHKCCKPRIYISKIITRDYRNAAVCKA